LKGSQIPLEVRIVHTVDAFDAMTSDRPYCRGMSHAEAMTRIRSSVGAMFDPEVVEAFQRVRAATALDSNEPSVRDYVQLARSLAGANLELHAAETSDGQDQLS
jgi:HD-GYP domain-containing protein (c-di-GMP phosphodiesterase class II)